MMATIEFPEMVRNSLRPSMTPLPQEQKANSVKLAARCQLLTTIIEGVPGIVSLVVQSQATEGKDAVAMFRDLHQLADEAWEECKARQDELVRMSAPSDLTEAVDDSLRRIAKTRKHLATMIADLEKAMSQPPTIPPGWTRGPEKYLTFDEVITDLGAHE